MASMNASASGSGRGEHHHHHHHHGHGSLLNDLERSLAASPDALEVDRFFNFGSNDHPDHRANLNHWHDHQPLPWMIGSSSGRWPPQYVQTGPGDDPYHDYHHAEHSSQHHVVPTIPQNVQTGPGDDPYHDYHHAEHLSQRHVVPTIPQNVQTGPRDDPYHDYNHAAHPSQRQSLLSPQPVVPTTMGQLPSNNDNNQFLPQWAQPTNLQLDGVIPKSFSAIWPKEWPSQDQYFAPNSNSMPTLPNLNRPSSGPVLPVTVPGLTQPMIPNQIPIAPKRDRSNDHTVAKGSARTSRRRRLVKAKSGHGISDSEGATQTYKFLPSNSGDVILACREEMKYNIFNTSLLPTTTEAATMAQRSWETAVSRQSADLRDWAHIHRRAQEQSLANVVDSTRSEMKEVARLFVFFRYDLQTYQMGVSHLVNRGVRVLHLLGDDLFLNVTLTINGRTITVPFGNPAVMAYIAYLLYDSRYQYHRYIGGPELIGPSPASGASALTIEKLRPLFTMTGTLFRWALEERRTGTVVDSELWVKNNRSYHAALVDKFDQMTPEQKDALQNLVDQIATGPLN
ncbi:hypothetical protein BD769DRAFT_1395154 [Suillus cothurnatus]|nr:hypothetical protein BD769DRAFT_1395154 [Suillus cothurnatus]